MVCINEQYFQRRSGSVAGQCPVSGEGPRVRSVFRARRFETMRGRTPSLSPHGWVHGESQNAGPGKRTGLRRPSPLQRRKHLIRNIDIRIDVLNIVELFQRIDQFHQALGAGGIHRNRRAGNQSNLA